jgi:hypothetical protein
MSVDGNILPFAVDPLTTPLGDGIPALTGQLSDTSAPLSAEDRQRLVDIQTETQGVRQTIDEASYADESVLLASTSAYSPVTDTEGYTGPGRYLIRGAPKIQKPVDNPLHAYASYTYNLSLHMLSNEDYNNVINANYFNSNPAPYVAKNVIISSAGRYNDENFKRNRHFKEDFYFEDFKMQTVILPTKRNTNSNLIECSFTIIEPNGFTLINRMIAAADEINARSVNPPGAYIQMAYVLQIDFFGYKDTADSKPEKISDMTKIIPIRIINVETQVRQSGAEYRVDAVPFNHQALSELNSTLPFGTTINASTVASAFNPDVTDYETANAFTNIINEQTSAQREVSQLTRLREQIVQTGGQDVDSITNLSDVDTRLATATANLKKITSTTVDVNSISKAFNDYYSALKDKGDIKYATKYAVIFDEEIGRAKLFSGPQPTDASIAGSNPNASNANTDAQAAGGAAKGNSLSYRSGVINVPAGSSMTSLIDFIVRQSDYILDQIVLPDQQQLATQLKNDVQGGSNIETIVQKFSKPLNWYKIVPTLKIGSWDDSLGRYVPEQIIFHVKKFTISSKYPYAPRGRVGGYVKKYDFMFTGRNRDILDWNIAFNTLYLLAVTAALNKSVQGSTGSGLNPAGSAADPTNTNVTQALPITGGPVATPGVAPVTGNSNTTTLVGGNTQKAIASGDLKNSLLLDARADMIELELKILGDPLFIKQDDFFYNRPTGDQDSALTANKSLFMDTGELYIFVNFLSPTDYDETIGLAPIKANEILGPETLIEAESLGYSNFSGVYKLITVDSVFSRGKFEQTLRMAKVLFDQIGIEYSALRQEQVKSISTSLVIAQQRSFRFNVPSQTEFLADANSVNAQLLTNFGLGSGSNLLNFGLNTVTQTAGRLTSDAVNQGVSVIRRNVGGLFDNISTVGQTNTQAPTQVAQQVLDVDWGVLPGSGI